MDDIVFTLWVLGATIHSQSPCVFFSINFLNVSIEVPNIHLFLYTHSLGSISTLTKQIIFFQKINSFIFFEQIYISIIYYNIVM